MWLVCLFACRCLCASRSLVQVHLQNTRFNEGREIGVRGRSIRGSLMQFVGTLTRISNISINSRLDHGSYLLGSVGGVTRVKDSKFEGLVNKFSHFSGGDVELKNLDVSSCEKFATFQTMDCKQETRPGRYHEWVGKGQFTASNCMFTNTYCSDGQAGGAVRFVDSTAKLTLSVCRFTNCKSRNGWGAAVFANAGSFSFNDCEVHDINAEFSVIHFQKGDQYGEFGAVKLERDKFINVQVNTSTDKEGDIQCGGSGLSIRYSLNIELSVCTFTDCKFPNGRFHKCAGALLFESLGDNPAEFTRVSLSGCTITGCNGKTGCLYVKGTVQTFTITKNCKFSNSGSTDTQNPYSIYVDARTFSMEASTIASMDGGNGRLWLGGVNQPVSFTNCEFNTWKTETLFVKSGGDIGLTLSGCKFLTVTVSGQQSFLQGTNSLTVTGCTFKTTTSDRALISVNSGSCSITGSTVFEAMTVSASPGQQVLIFSGSKLTLESVTFNSSSNVNGFLLVNAGDISLSKVYFKKLTVQRDPVPPLLKFVSGTLTRFQNCQFDTCTYSKAAFIRLEVSPPSGDGIKDCLFKACVSDWALIKCTSGRLLTMNNCRFEELSGVKYPLLSIEASSLGISLSQTTLSNVKFSSNVANRNIIIFEGSATGASSVSIDNMNVVGSSFKSLLSCPITESVVIDKSTFTDTTMVMLLNIPTCPSVYLQNTDFSGCQGQVLSTQSPDVTLQNCGFSNCYSDQPLIQLGLCSMTLAGCCFQREDQSRGSSYIKGPEDVKITPNLPLCFDRSQEESIDFNGANPLEAISSSRNIFNCDNCSSQSTVEPSEEVVTSDEVVTSEEQEVTSDEEVTSDDEEVTSDESLTEVLPTSPSGGGGDSGAKKGGLGAGEIAGILIGILIIIAVIVLVVILLLRRKKEEKSGGSVNGEMDEENTDDAVTTFTTYDTVPEMTEDNPLFTKDGTGAGTTEFAGFEEEWT